MSQGITLLLRSVMIGRFYNLVSVIGLAVAIAAVILVSALLQHETAYEKNFSAADRVYRLNWINNGTGDRFATMFNPFSPQFAAATPDVQYATRVGTFEVLLQKEAADGNRGFGNLELIAFVDPDFFRIFDLSTAIGDTEIALTSRNSIVLTRAAAEKYFPGEPATGKTLMLENDLPLTVTTTRRRCAW